MGAELSQLLTPGNPYGAQANMSQRYGRRAAGYHGAGSGHAARSGFNDMTMMDREAARRQQLQALAGLIGGQLQSGAGIASANGYGPQQMGADMNRQLQPLFTYTKGQLIPANTVAPSQPGTLPGQQGYQPARKPTDPYEGWS